jgi:hypothetical protein
MTESTTPAAGGVFISYRRQDTGPYARLLYEELRRRLDSEQVFMDVDSIEVGVDFAEAIQHAVAACEVLLALVGPQWLTITDANGQQRLEDPDDTVRLEIEAALTRNIRVIPVLVDNTLMPQRQQLPESLAPFSRRNALELSYNRYGYDLGRLLEAIERVLGQRFAPVAATSTPPSMPAPAGAKAAGSPSVGDLVSQAKAAAPAGKSGPMIQILDDSHPLWNRHSGGSGHEGNEWTLGDVTEAEAFYASVKGKAKDFMDVLIDRPGQPLDVDEIVKICPKVFQGSRSIAGALNGLRLAKEASGRRYPFYWWKGNPTRYAMKPSVAEVFRQARRDLGS